MGHKADCFPLGSPSRSSDSVDISRNLIWEIEVDDQLDTLEVDPPGKLVGRYQNTRLGFSETLHILMLLPSAHATTDQ